MIKKYLFIAFSLMLLANTAVEAQYETHSRKAKSLYNEALNAYANRNVPEAVQLLEKAIKKDKEYVQAYLVLAEAYIDIRKPESAMETYESAFTMAPDYFPGAYLSYARVARKLGEYTKARDAITSMLEMELDDKTRKKADHLLKEINFAIKAVNNPVEARVTNLGDSINSPLDEYWPSVSIDEGKMVFTRRVPMSKNPMMRASQEDFYISYKQDSTWSKAKRMSNAVNTMKNEGAHSLSADGKKLLFTYCGCPDGIDRCCDLYISRTFDTNWSTPLKFNQNINSAAKESRPSLSADGKQLYFISQRAGGKGIGDIWVSTRGTDGSWQQPVNLGDSINTEEDEQSVFIHPDGKTLYFSSNGHIGMGGYDIYLSRLDKNGNWSKAENMGYPVNTPGDEIDLVVSPGGDYALMSSAANEENGLDIFKVTIPASKQPDPVTYMKGTIRDSEYKTNLEAKYELIDLNTSKVIYEDYSEPKTGEFLVCIPSNRNYALNVSKKGYLFYSENFSLEGVHSFDEPYKKDIELQKINIGKTTVLRNIFFALDSYELKPESKVELDKLVKFLENNPGIKIEIGGHTDNQGTDEYNIELSRNRAREVVDYLVKNGVPNERLSFKGYGEHKPLVENSTPGNRSINRRTEFKIIEK